MTLQHYRTIPLFHYKLLLYTMSIEHYKTATIQYRTTPLYNNHMAHYNNTEQHLYTILMRYNTATTIQYDAGHQYAIPS